MPLILGLRKKPLNTDRNTYEVTNTDAISRRYSNIKTTLGDHNDSASSAVDPDPVESPIFLGS